MIVASLPTVRQPDFLVAASDAGLSPYMLGVLDAERGEMCVPEMYFTKRGQMCEYAEGHEAVKSETLLSCQVLGKASPVTDAQVDQLQEQAEIDMESDDYAIEDDYEWIRRGC